MKLLSDKAKKTTEATKTAAALTQEAAAAMLSTATDTTNALIESEDVANGVRSGYFQWIEGVSHASSMPFTILKSAGLPETRQLATDNFTYNFLYYALPAFMASLIQGRVAPDLALDEYFVLGCIAFFCTAWLTRAQINALLFNVGNNQNATSLSFHKEDALAPEACDCKESAHIKATLMSPLYYFGKILTVNILSGYKFLYYPVEYFLQPLLYGEAILDANSPELCAVKKNEFLSRNVMLSYGIGFTTLVYSWALNQAITFVTGVNSPFVLDAIFSLNYAFMLMHIKDHKLRKDINQPYSLDIFYLTRKNIDILLEIISDRLKPKDGEVVDLKNVYESLQKIENHPITTLACYLLFYEKLSHELKQNLLEGPFSLFVTLNKDKFSPIIDKLINIARASKLTRNVGKMWYSDKEHIVYILKVIDKNPVYAEALLCKVKSIIAKSDAADRNQARWNTSDNAPCLRLKEEYQQLNFNKPSASTFEDLHYQPHYTPFSNLSRNRSNSVTTLRNREFMLSSNSKAPFPPPKPPKPIEHTDIGDFTLVHPPEDGCVRRRMHGKIRIVSQEYQPSRGPK